MADLIVIEFPTEAKAEEVRQKLLSMQQDYIIDIKDAVIAVKQPDGHIKLNQLYHPTAIGAASGAVWGTIVGLIPRAFGWNGGRRGVRCGRRRAFRCRHQR